MQGDSFTSVFATAIVAGLVWVATSKLWRRGKPEPGGLRKPLTDDFEKEVEETFKEMDETFAKLSPPKDLRSPADWDTYWKYQLESGFAGFGDMMISDEALVTRLRERGLQSILVAGNGISMEPRSLEAAGFAVTVLDISPLAIRVAEEARPPAQNIEMHIGKGAARPGGSVTCVRGDVLDASNCPGPFDVVIERLTAQNYLAINAMPEFLSALEARLSPNGVFVSHCHNGGWRPGQPRTSHTEPWFRERGYAIARGDGSLRKSGRTAWLVVTTG